MMLSIPNVSEGRRLDLIQSTADAVMRVAGVRLLDRSSDPSHNRSVFTLAGDGPGLAAAVIAIFEQAIASIDLRLHEGEHPRFGAVDVVPFVPLADASMADAVALAKTVGGAVAGRFGVPVYLYGDAAATAARRRLEDVRRGQFEHLAARMATPGWAPDFGPLSPHPTAGATAVGARQALVAFNVNLATSRIEIARRVAAAVRERGGGLPAVKALAFTLHHRGVVQVSMNLTDYRQTSLVSAFEAVRREAGRDGVPILESEIVGLVPAAALAGVAPEDLLLKSFGPERILENRLRTIS